MTGETGRVLTRLGADTRTYSPSGLGLPDDAEADHPKVQELRDLVTGSEGTLHPNCPVGARVRSADNRGPI